MQACSELFEEEVDPYDTRYLGASGVWRRAYTEDSDTESDRLSALPPHGGYCSASWNQGDHNTLASLRRV